MSGESHGQRSLEGYGPWGHKESDTTEVTAPTHTRMQKLSENSPRRHPPSVKKDPHQELNWPAPWPSVSQTPEL